MDDSKANLLDYEINNELLITIWTKGINVNNNNMVNDKSNMVQCSLPLLEVGYCLGCTYEKGKAYCLLVYCFYCTITDDNEHSPY